MPQCDTTDSSSVPARQVAITGQPLAKKDLDAVSKKAIVLRMLHNLLNVAQHEQDRPAMLRYLDGILTLDRANLAERRRAEARGIRPPEDELLRGLDARRGRIDANPHRRTHSPARPPRNRV